MADAAQVAHLLRRTETVVRPERLVELVPLPLEQVVDDVLDFTRNPPGGLVLAEQESNRDVALRWWLERMATVPRPLQEKLVMFWHGHFVSSWLKVPSVQALIDQNELFRRYAAGDLRVLTRSMALQCAMLVYLDNHLNSKWSPNQNFARELLELFTLGIVDHDTGQQPYTEADVEAGAAAWTGHGLRYSWDQYHQYEFHPRLHDTGDKVFFGVIRAWDGPETIDLILRDDPTRRSIAAKFIVRKMWEFFAHPLPPGPSTLVDELAAVLVAHRMRVKPMLRAMFLRPEFYSAAAHDGLVRTPTDLVVALRHHSGVPFDAWLNIWRMSATGQVPFYPPDVSGWRPNGAWINTSALGGRATLARLVAGQLAGRDPSTGARRPLHTELMALPPTAAFDRVAAMLYTDPATEISDVTRRAVLTYLQDPASATDEWKPEYLILMLAMAPEFHVA